MMEVALEAGAEDVIADEDGAIEVITAVADFETVKERAGGGRILNPEDGRGDHAPGKPD
jgi:transcriptional/translational regulatory protein YebC/TACO1